MLREGVSMRGQKVFKKFFKIARAQKKTRAAHPLPSLMTNVLPALPHARRSARGVPMNAEPDAEAAWVFASTWKTAEGLELGIQMKTGCKTNAVNCRRVRAGRTVSQFRSPAVSSIMSLTKPAAPPSPTAPMYLHKQKSVMKLAASRNTQQTSAKT